MSLKSLQHFAVLSSALVPIAVPEIRSNPPQTEEERYPLNETENRRLTHLYKARKTMKKNDAKARELNAEKQLEFDARIIRRKANKARNKQAKQAKQNAKQNNPTKEPKIPTRFIYNPGRH